VAALHKRVLKLASPGSLLLDAAGVSRSNTLRQIANPGAMVATNTAEGKPLTVSSATDPAGFTRKEPVTPPPVVPMPDEEQIKTNRRRQATAAQLARQGRQSTILTDTTDRLGP
jgi:hypothetical protein